MPHQPFTQRTAERSGPGASATMARARLLGVDAQRPKRIDRQIDYFGSGGGRRLVVDSDPCGESLLDAALTRFLHVILRGAHGGRRPVIHF